METDKRIRELKGFPKISPLIADKVRPNDLCPCGSGKKSKKCCGSRTIYKRAKLENYGNNI